MSLCPICNSELNYNKIQGEASCKNSCIIEKQIIYPDYFYHYINIFEKEFIIEVRNNKWSDTTKRQYDTMMIMVDWEIKNRRSNLL